MSTRTQPPERPRRPTTFDVDDPRYTRFDLVREGARRDGVEIVHYAPRFPVRGTKAEKRVERAIALLLTLSGLFAFGFVVAYIWWPWRYELGRGRRRSSTPRCSASTLGGSLLFARHRDHHLGQEAAAGGDRRSRTATTARRRATSRSSPARRSSTWSTRPGSSAGRCSRRRSCCRPPGSASPRWRRWSASLIKNPNDGHILLTTGLEPCQQRRQAKYG